MRSPPCRDRAEPTRQGFLWDGVALCALGWTLRMVVVFAYGSDVPPAADGTFYHVVAQRIAEGAGYTWVWPDGAVTFAAHYPVGYAALLGGAYALGGAQPMVAMGLNACLGALAVLATHRLALRSGGRRGALLAGSFVAVSPTLVGYSLALMTEGAVAAGWVVSVWLAVCGSERSWKSRWPWGIGCALVLGATSLLRPQSLLLAPILGWILALRSTTNAQRWGWVLGMCGLAVTVCLPWTLRNCVRMDRCVLVSANGGWNLLIGTYPEGEGAWVPIEGERVPEACREVFAEAKKDACFGAAGRQRIVEDPIGWLGLVPAKLRATFDFTASASAYLGEAGASLPTKHLPSLEVGVRRVLLALALIGAWRLGQAPPLHREKLRLLRAAGALVGLGCLFLALAWVSHLVFVVLIATAWGFDKRPELLAAGGAVTATLLIHGIFFGAGRYSMVLEPLLAVVAAAAVARRGSFLTPLDRPGDTAAQEPSPCP